MWAKSYGSNGACDRHNDGLYHVSISVVSLFDEEDAFVVCYNLCNTMYQAWGSKSFPHCDTKRNAISFKHVAYYFCIDLRNCKHISLGN